MSKIVENYSSQMHFVLYPTLQRGHSMFPFDEVIHAHAGDPQGMGQKPITFFQQVNYAFLFVIIQ